MSLKERKNQYRLLCEQGKILSLFMQPWWLDATSSWDVSFAVRNNQTVGALPFAYRKKWGITYLGMPVLTQYLHLWMDKPPDISDHKWLTREKQIIWLLIDNLPRIVFFPMVFAENSFDNWLPFHWKGFRQEMRYTFVIDRADEKTIDDQINRNLKRNIREASAGITIKKEVDSKLFFDLCRNTFKRQLMAMPYSFDTFSKIDQAITEHNAGIKLAAYSNEELVAVAYLLWDDTKAYYFLAGDNEAGRSSGAAILICREALRIAFEEKNVQSFDFCGSMLEQITEIRRQFGARSVPLMKIFKANYRWLDILYRIRR